MLAILWGPTSSATWWGSNTDVDMVVFEVVGEAVGLEVVGEPDGDKGEFEVVGDCVGEVVGSKR